MAEAMNSLPRGPLSTGKSGTMDTADGYKAAIRNFRESCREEALASLRLNPEYDQVKTYQRYLAGEQWERNRPPYRSKFVDNRMAQVRVETLSLLTDIRPTIDITSKAKEYEHQAEVAKKVILHEWRRLNLDMALVAAVDHALFGVGYWRMGALMPGQLIVVPLGMDAVIPIQGGRDIQDSSGVLYRTYKPLSYFRQNFGDKADGLEREQASMNWMSSGNAKPGHVDEFTWSALSPQMRSRMGLKRPRMNPSENLTFPVIPLEEYWIDDPAINEYGQDVTVKHPDLSEDEHNYWYKVAPRQRLFPRKRLMVFAGDRIMYDGPSMYWHGFYPFVKLVLNPITWGPDGFSKYRFLKPIQDAINEIGAGTLDTIKKAVNQTVITKSGVVRPTAWQRFFPDLPGGKLEISPSAQIADVRYIDPPNLPGYVFQFGNAYLLPAFDRHAGSLDPSALTRKKQVPGQDTIESMKDSLQAAFRIESRYVEVFLRDAGAQAVALIFQFFTGSQRLRIMGADGLTREDFDYSPGMMTPWSISKESHHKNFEFSVGQGSLHGSSQDRAKQVAILLRRTRDISRKELFRQMNIANGEQIESELQDEMKSGMAPQPTGRTPRLSRRERTGGM